MFTATAFMKSASAEHAAFSCAPFFAAASFALTMGTATAVSILVFRLISGVVRLCGLVVVRRSLLVGSTHPRLRTAA